ncbi:GNAT family N-acetyltransferase [uncultured Roseovarius sp.]|uniref:GNAT family N-acetyltransferase n=1 Tax=uncultured Roseovarius sp. TaxID=293344 RepID=UPI0026099087|nr:GNAT family N-acetyltransferase [uncultured Roseovarius sp.]
MPAIRPATPADEPAIRACAEDAYAQYVAAIGRKPQPMIADFASAIATGHAHVICADNAEIDGFIVFFPRGDHMFLENVAVFTRAAGQGLGKALIGFCESEAKRLGLMAVELYTNEKMTGNQALYPRLGYAENFRRTEDGFRRIYYRKALR